MFGANYYGQSYFAQGPTGYYNLTLHLIKATTRAVAGFFHTTRRDF